VPDLISVYCDHAPQTDEWTSREPGQCVSGRCFGFEIWSLRFVSDFVLRISNFIIQDCDGAAVGVDAQELADADEFGGGADVDDGGRTEGVRYVSRESVCESESVRGAPRL
jgi:hypothetical protein